MEPKVIIALLLVIVLVVGVNGLLLVALRSGRDSKQIQMLQKAARVARDPWQNENKDLAELSRLVADLKTPGENSEDSQ